MGTQTNIRDYFEVEIEAERALRPFAPRQLSVITGGAVDEGPSSNLITVRILYIILSSYLFAGAVLYIFQDHLIFTGIGTGEVSASFRPSSVSEEIWVAPDGEKLQVWRASGESDKPVVLISQGTQGGVSSNAQIFQFFHSFGFTTYGYSLRGYEKSRGWPTEELLNQDASFMAEDILEREGISGRELIIVGASLSSGSASKLAKEISPKALVLFSPLTSFRDLLLSKPAYGPFFYLSRYDFPVLENVKELNPKTSLMLVHGEKDKDIPPHMASQIFAAFAGENKYLILEKEAAHHNIFEHSKDNLRKLLAGF